MGRVCDQLWEVEEEDQFVSEEIDHDLAEVHTYIHQLVAAPTPRFTDALDAVRERTALFAMERLGAEAVLENWMAAGAEPTGPPPTPPLPATVPPSNAAELNALKRREFWRELFFAVAAFVIALITGLAALYMGKAWGTWLDYATAFLWGIVTKTALDLLLAPSIDQLAKVRPFGPLFRGV